jgi:hypothetical protein
VRLFERQETDVGTVFVAERFDYSSSMFLLPCPISGCLGWQNEAIPANFYVSSGDKEA